METLSHKLALYLSKQLEGFFPDSIAIPTILPSAIEISLKELKENFSYINNKYYLGDFNKVFNYLNGDHYSMFLYKVSHHVYKSTGDEILASKIFNLNKALHGIDAFYKIQLPQIFLFVHPLGTVLGNAKYNDFFCVYQGCTVGSKKIGLYPVFEGKTIMYSNSSLIGSSHVGKNTILAAGSRVVDTNIEDNSLVIGTKPQQEFKKVKMEYFEQVFKIN